MSSDSATTTDNVIVSVSAERLAELESIEAKYKVDQEKKKERLKMLEERQTPDSHRKQALKHYETHKDEINAKRREKRRLARETKEAAEKSKTPGEGL